MEDLVTVMSSREGHTAAQRQEEEGTPFNLILQNGKHRFQAFES